MIYTLVSDPFRKWVDRLVDTRHENDADKRELHIDLDPEIAAIYNKSKAVSVS